MTTAAICRVACLSALTAISLSAQLPASNTLLERAATQRKAGDYSGELATLRSALPLVESEQGADSLPTAAVLLRLADVQSLLGGFPEGLQFANRALAIYQTRLGPDHPSVAQALLALGTNRTAAADYAAGQPFYERALAIRERVAPDSPDLAAILNQYGGNLLRLGDYARAKLTLQRAIDIYERQPAGAANASGPALRILAQVLTELGDYAGADRCLQRALAILETQTGPDSVSVADLLTTLGNSAKEQGHYEPAVQAHERAVHIYQTRLGPRNTRVGGALDNLGQTLLLLKRYQPARDAFQTALSIQTEALGARSPWTANVIQGLAKVAAATGDYAESKRLYEQNLDIWREQLGATHPFTVASLTQYAVVLARLGSRPQALATALEAARIRRDQIFFTVRTVEERQALQYASVKMTSLDTALSLAPDGSADDRRATWDSVIRTRGIVLDEMAARRRAIHQSNDPALPALLSSLTAARSELAKLAVQGRGRLSNAEYDAKLESARARVEQMAGTLAVSSAAYRLDLARQHSGFDEVRAALPPGAALIAWRRYQRQDFSQPGAEGAPAYLAFVLTHASPLPRIVRLGGAAHIDSLVRAWRLEMERERDSRGRNATANEAASRRAGDALRRAVWDPLAPLLRGATQIYTVPDGSLQLVNLAALPSGTTHYLLEDVPVLHVLSAERDLAAPPPPPAGPRSLLAVGNPAFQMRTPARPVLTTSTATSPLYRGARSGCSDFAQLQFAPLPGSAGEVHALVQLVRRQGWDTETLDGPAANEAAVKDKAGGRRILHLATHGFFLGEECRDSAVARENPLLRSGLALAGANLRNSAAPGQEDGILTAEEAASLDLEGADWVVLSGCDTGVGELSAGEGVLGLRSAFLEAGARTVITSLWPVRDDEALVWMSQLYESRIARNQSTASAVRDATLHALRQRRAAQQSTHPFHWASFLAVGDWR